MILRRFVIINALVILGFTSLEANSKLPTFCGWDPSWDNVYYPIIDQFSLVDEDNKSFLNCPDIVFCDYFPNSNDTNYNIDEWYNYFKGSFSKEELRLLVYKKSIQWLQGEEDVDENEKLMYTNINQKKYTFFKRYLILAKGTESLASDKTYDSGWYQGETLSFEDKSPWLEKAVTLIKDAPDQFFKNRVGFQIVRLAHYKQDNDLAISAFKRYLELNNSSRYIYYRALEQVSGAYFNLNQHSIAAQNYLEVFKNLPDRRERCALSLRFMDWSQLNENSNFYKDLKHKDIFHFFKAYYGRGDVLKEMKKIAEIDVNSPYLEVLTARLIDDIQSQLFEHDDNGYYFEGIQNTYTDESEIIIDEILVNKTLKDKSTLTFLKALLQIKKGKYSEAKATLNTQLQWHASKIHKKRLLFAIDFMDIKTPNRQQINKVFKQLDEDKDLNTYKPVVAAFFNHISALYSKDNPLLSAFIAIDYDSYPRDQPFDWSTINNNYAYNYELETKYSFLKIDVINSLDEFVKLKSFTHFEQIILDRVKVDVNDFIHELRGTYFLREKELYKALKEFEAIKNTSEFWNEDVRPELFSGSIKEWMNVDFNSISDQFHVKYLEELKLKNTVTSDDEPVGVRENYRDNKIKLTKALIKLETLAKQEKENAAEYYYMLGNAWYNMSAVGWFVNNLYYVGNDNRNELMSESGGNTTETTDNAMMWAEKYFKKGIESKGDNEVKARLTFMLAKTESCFDYTRNNQTNEYDFYLCENHQAHFKDLRDNYSESNYYQEVLKQCSWLRWYNDNY